MQKTVTINDVDLVVDYTGTEYRPATRLDPAEGGEVEILSVCLDGNDFTEMLADWVISQIRTKLESELADDFREERACAEEDRAERLHDERQWMREAA